MPAVFSPAWFQRHQQRLLWLLACPLIGRWFRWCLCIRSCDVGYHGRIVALYPHAYTVDHGNGTRSTDFRTHAKYAKRLYCAFRPVWWMAHAFDMLIANPLRPAWNLGCDTLTTYPDAGSGAGTFAVDGFVYRAGVEETWATIRAGAGTGAADTSTPERAFSIRSFSSSGNWFEIVRSIFLFDTSSLNTGDTITAAVLSLYGSSKADPLSITPNADIYTSTPAADTALVAGDFTQIATTSQTGSPITYASLVTSAYNAFTFNATGRGNVSKTANSKFGCRNANYDVSGTVPTWSASVTSEFRVAFADAAGLTQDPKLVVTFTPPPPPVPGANERVRVFINSVDRTTVTRA